MSRPFGDVGKLPRGLPQEGPGREVRIPGRGEGGPPGLPTEGEGLPGGITLPEGPQVPLPGTGGLPTGPGAPPEAPRPPPARLPTPRDGFGQAPTEGGSTLLAQAAQVPARTVRALLPALERFRGHEAVAARFAADLPLLRAQVLPRGLPATEGAARLWAFFTAYAEAATRGHATPEGLTAFRQALDEQGFGHFLDAHTGTPGVEVGMWVLQAAGPESARQRAEAVQLVPVHAPPEESAASPAPQAPPAERAAPPAELRDSAFVPSEAHARAAEERFAQTPREQVPLERVQGRADTFRVNTLAAEAGRPLVQPVVEERAGALEGARERGRPGRLGTNMLFNVLHRFRGEGEDSSLQKAKWDRMAFGAVLLLVGLTLVAILLVSL